MAAVKSQSNDNSDIDGSAEGDLTSVKFKNFKTVMSSKIDKKEQTVKDKLKNIIENENQKKEEVKGFAYLK